MEEEENQATKKVKLREPVLANKSSISSFRDRLVVGGRVRSEDVMMEEGEITMGVRDVRIEHMGKDTKVFISEAPLHYEGMMSKDDEEGRFGPWMVVQQWERRDQFRNIVKENVVGSRFNVLGGNDDVGGLDVSYSEGKDEVKVGSNWLGLGVVKNGLGGLEGNEVNLDPSRQKPKDGEFFPFTRSNPIVGNMKEVPTSLDKECHTAVRINKEVGHSRKSPVQIGRFRRGGSVAMGNHLERDFILSTLLGKPPDDVRMVDQNQLCHLEDDVDSKEEDSEGVEWRDPYLRD
ncbi:hypothetical protein GH714_033284 [Hevea brasiliensis]|uniref:Uncharacterized protein n=1 Tax=Hevea brasiliensis TaxID=3981 RepID=A0A6A6NKB7_HEVBR|nr:hypothetical protein GH714_033284 [Hevea brasiliensis]